jgi:DNA-binding response OmpR family regulator
MTSFLDESSRQPIRLLVVDDDVALLDYVSTLLSHEPIDLAVATDGETAIEIARRSPPDIILLDVFLPGIDGIEVCRRLKADPTTQSIPVMIMTASLDLERRVEALTAGAADYVSKPLHELELLARLRTQIEVRRAFLALVAENARLQAEMAARRAAEAEREGLLRELVARNQELSLAKQQIEAQLTEQAHMQAARAALESQVIAAHEERLRELATPFIPISDSIAVMPLIGRMDAARAREVTDVALESTAAQGFKSVILDVTGVREIDGAVAAMLVDVGRGLELLGARAVLTGLRAEMARALVSRDVSLGKMATESTLKAGIARAMRADEPSPARGRGTPLKAARRPPGSVRQKSGQTSGGRS